MGSIYNNSMDNYFTTPIFYPNSKPHLGTAYTLIIGDFFKRYYAQKGSCFFLTGTDEHGKKVAEAAQVNGLTPQQHVDNQRENFLQLKSILNLEWDHFIYTSSPKHQQCAQQFWMDIYNKGLIYKGTYKGWYSQRDEQFFKESELVDGKAPTGATVELMEEECYFFKLSQFKDAIIDLYNDETIIVPHWRSKEIVNNLKHHGLEDLCVSRHKSRLSWGIPVPNDDNHVMYVWFDALTNYLTALDYPHLKTNYWAHSHHIIGKDIVYFHGVIWPAMLMAAGLPCFKQLIVHGWITVNNEKMSKSLGNVVDPVELCKTISSDYLKYFLLREIPLSSDYDFNWQLLISRINDELADKMGNLVNRVINMVGKYCGGVIPQGTEPSIVWNEDLMDQWVEKREINNYIQEILMKAIELNKYIENRAPWKKDVDQNDRNKILWECCCGIYAMAKFLGPVTPIFSEKIMRSLGVDGYHGWAHLQGKVINPQGILIEKIIDEE